MFLTDEAATTTEEAAETAVSIDWNALLNSIVEWCMTTGLKLIIGFIVLIISFKITNFIFRRIFKHFSKRKHDETILKVITSSGRILVKVLLVVAYVGVIGIETASISAVIASLGVGISLAVQGTLSNFAGGVIIIIMRPFRIGDFITSSGESGTVEDIKLFYTHVITTDNRTIFIPNGTLANNVIVNASMKDTRRVDLTYSVSYDTNTKEAKQVILDVINKHMDQILVEPAPFVTVSDMGDSGIEMTSRVWVKASDYWNVKFTLIEEVKNAMDEAGIEVPYTQLDVNIRKTLDK